MARPRSDIQERILAAAQARFLAEGVDAASLRNIARDAETSIGMVYYYYATKDDLFFAIVEEKYQRILTDLEAILVSCRSFRERLTGLYARVGTMSQGETDVIHLIVRESFTSHDRRDRLKRRFLRGHLPLLIRAILDAIAAGEVDKEIDPIVVMACVLGFGGASTMLAKLVEKQIGAGSVAADAPDFMRDLLCRFTSGHKNCDGLAEQLAALAVRAITPHG